VLSAIPVLIYNMVSGYADAPIGCFFRLLVMLFYWDRTERCGISFSGILSVAIKNEGAAIVTRHPVNVLAASRFGRAMKQIPAKSAVISSSPSYPADAGTSPNSTWRCPADNTAVHSIRRVWGRLNNLFVFRSHNLFWSGIIVLLVWKWRAACAARFFLAVRPRGATLYVFLFTPNVAWLIDGTTTRTLLIVIPVRRCRVSFSSGGRSVVVVPHDRWHKRVNTDDAQKQR
jgi:hypothetical protein